MQPPLAVPSGLSGFSPPEACPNIPAEPGVYALVDETGIIFYIGSSKRVRQRVGHLLALQPDQNSYGYTHLAAERLQSAQEQGKSFSVLVRLTPDYKELERKLISEHSPLWNRL